MRKLIATVALAIAGVLLAAAPAAAHLCQNVSKPYGAGAVTPDKVKVTPSGHEVFAGGWVDLGVIFDIEECAGQETNAHVFLHPAAAVGSEDHGIQFLSAECIAVLEEFLGEET